MLITNDATSENWNKIFAPPKRKWILKVETQGAIRWEPPISGSNSEHKINVLWLFAKEASKSNLCSPKRMLNSLFRYKQLYGTQKSSEVSKLTTLFTIAQIQHWNTNGMCISWHKCFCHSIDFLSFLKFWVIAKSKKWQWEPLKQVQYNPGISDQKSVTKLTEALSNLHCKKFKDHVTQIPIKNLFWKKPNCSAREH